MGGFGLWLIFFRSDVIGGRRKLVFVGLSLCPASSWWDVVAVGWLVVGLGGAGWVVNPPCTGACGLVME